MNRKDLPYATALPPGTILQGNSRYTILKVLGAGGFGITYLASTAILYGNLKMTVYVAIKEHFMADNSDRDGDSLTVITPGTERMRMIVKQALRDFESEARRLAKIGVGHQNIVKVNEIFNANGTSYYVMEYLDGQSLADYVSSYGPLDTERLNSLLVPIVDAVAYLHRNNFTHLDIKPANIMITADENGGMRPVLIDFGLSKHYDESGNATSTVNTFAISDGFAPIEQYSGITTFSPGADVYALGATLYACALGRNPKTATLWMPGELDSEIAQLPNSTTLRETIRKAMQPNASMRYANAAEMLDDMINTNSTSNSGVVTQIIPSDIITGGVTERYNKGCESDYSGANHKLVNNHYNYGIDDTSTNPYETINYWGGKLVAHHLDLAVERDGIYYYLSNYDYISMPENVRHSLRKIGVVVIGFGKKFANQKHFIISLDDIESDIDWFKAFSLYKDYLPTKEQCDIWISNIQSIRESVIAFGGHMEYIGDYVSYWTKDNCEYNDMLAWKVYFYNAKIYCDEKTTLGNVRAFIPL